MSRHDGIITPPPAAKLTDPDGDQDIIDEKPVKLEIDESQGGNQSEDQRPAVFKSTFWEVLCVASLVCAQLTNVHFSLLLDHSNG